MREPGLMDSGGHIPQRFEDITNKAHFISELKTGDPLLWDQLYRIGKHYLLRRISDFTTNEADQEDILQQTWSKAFAQRDQLNSNVKNWLSGIATNTAIDYVKGKSNRQSYYLPGDKGLEVALRQNVGYAQHGWYQGDHLRSPEYLLTKPPLAEDLDRIIALIPNPEMRTVIKLYYFDGKKQTDISTELNIPSGTINRHAQLGREYIARTIRCEQLLANFSAEFKHQLDKLPVHHHIQDIAQWFYIEARPIPEIMAQINDTLPANKKIREAVLLQWLVQTQEEIIALLSPLENNQPSLQ
jgi:RNA polymerase sigma factor (sigma-70 family)